jgi:hypothetical protein
LSVDRSTRRSRILGHSGRALLGILSASLPAIAFATAADEPSLIRRANIFGATETQHSLAGGEVGKWLAPNISGNPRWGIADRSVSGIVTFLKTARKKRRAPPSDPSERP